MAIDPEKKTWTVTHYRPDGIGPLDDNQALNMAGAGYTISYEPSYYIEKFIATFGNTKLPMPKKIEEELSKLVITGNISKALCDIIAFQNFAANEINNPYTVDYYDLDGGRRKIEETFIATNNITSTSIVQCLERIISENIKDISDDLLEYLVSINIEFADLFISAGRITENTGKYLVLKNPSKYVSLLDKANLLQPIMIDTLLTLNPIAIYYIPETSSGWHKEEEIQYSSGETRIKTLETVKTYKQYTSDAILEIVNEFKAEDNDNELFRFWRDRDNAYCGFSWALGLGDKEKIIKHFVNLDGVPYVGRLRAIKFYNLYAKNPTPSDMNAFGRKVAKLFKTDKVYGDKKFNKQLMDYIEAHKDLMKKEIYEDCFQNYYPDLLLDELKVFGVEENTKKKKKK